MKKYRKVFIFTIIIFVLMLICQGIYLQYQSLMVEDYLLYNKSEKYNDVLHDLRKEKELLNLELDDLYEELYTGDLGSTVILLTDTHSECLDDIVSLMKKYNYEGVIALSYQYLPENNHKHYLNREEIDGLVEDGFELVIKATNEDLTKTYEKFAKLGYDIKGFYFEDIVVTSLMADEIKGIDPNMAIIGNYLDGVGITDTLLINYYGSRQQNVMTYYDDSIKESKVIALSVGYDKSFNRFEKRNFTNMLNIIDDYERDDKTEVCNITDAIERNSIYNDKLSSVDPERYERVNEIKQRLA